MSPSYRLHYSPGTASLAVHWMLIELGARFELVRVDHAAGGTRTPEFLALNPSGHVPVLEIDGVPHAEVAALLMRLAERHPEARLAPAPDEPGRADYLQLMVFLTNTLMPAFRAWYYPHEPAGAENAEAVKAHAAPRIDAIFARLDARFADGRPYVLGERMSAADFLLTMLTRWSRTLPRTAYDHPRLAAYIDRMRALPSLRETHAREGLSDWIEG